MQEPIETVLIHAQQSFEIAGGLNPFQIELKDDRVLNLLKKYKNATYKLTPLGILFPASLTNDTRQMLITCREINDIKKALTNGKIYGLLGIIDLKKINDWEEIKSQSIWVKSSFVEQKEINNNRHMCFPFTTKTLNDLLSFSIYLLDDNNNRLAFLTVKRK